MKTTITSNVSLLVLLHAAVTLQDAVHGFVSPGAPTRSWRRQQQQQPSTTIALVNTRMATRGSRIQMAAVNGDSSNTATPASTSSSSSSLSAEDEAKFDQLLESGKLNQAIRCLKEHGESLSIDRQRWQKIFDAIEVRTAEAEENNVNVRQESASTTSVEYPLISPARMDMTNMYETLKELSHLKLYGAVSSPLVPAAGSHVVTPLLLEKVTNLTMTALTPKPTPTLLIAGIALAAAEALLSVAVGINFNLLVGITLLLAFFDKLFANGAVFESFLKVFSPGISQKITKHEAGHLLCAYLLGNPVEGCVLSAWAALQDARFDKRNVSAGTSFFDPQLSKEMNSQRVTRTSVDRYSIIVMAGIAAEAMQFGRADGGAGDEMALVAFLSQLNRGGNTWNDGTIRNQARWGALQAVLLLHEYQPCYDALVDALERGGTLGDCIHAIEKAGRDNDLQPLERPLGYILEQGLQGEWTTQEPPSDVATALTKPPAATGPPVATQQTMTQDELHEYKAQVERRLQEIDERIREIDS